VTIIGKYKGKLLEYHLSKLSSLSSCEPDLFVNFDLKHVKKILTCSELINCIVAYACLFFTGKFRCFCCYFEW